MINMTTLKKYDSKEILDKIDSAIYELNAVKNMIKDTDYFNEVVMTEEVSKSNFKESEKTLKSTRTLRNKQLENEYKDYMNKDSMPSIFL